MSQLFFVLSVALQLSSVLGHLIVEISRSLLLLLARNSHTHTHTHSRTSVSEWSAHCWGCYLQNTQQTKEMNIHTSGGFISTIPAIDWL